MKNYIKHDPWSIIEEGFQPELNRVSESLFSIGNGRMGQRANFEETYSGDSHQGHYLAGVYYPDKTRVGWWKNGYPEYFAKVLNAPSWIGIRIRINGVDLDLANWEVLDFKRQLNMYEGHLQRWSRLKDAHGNILAIHSIRFCSVSALEIGAINYSVRFENFDGSLEFIPYISSDVFNEDSNYDEQFWDTISCSSIEDGGINVAETKKTGFRVATGMNNTLFEGNSVSSAKSTSSTDNKICECSYGINASKGVDYSLVKIGAISSSMYNQSEDLVEECRQLLNDASAKGFEALLDDHKQVWKQKWSEIDIEIVGDVSAQQGIRFNIFQMHQTYTGEDPRLNIGPKGFTGEKYGGSTYWDTEAYCLPFYLATADQSVARNLLVYRYKHLEKAIENAEKLGFENGAALYPMVTMNGEECHNEWEITFEEIHRNGAIAYAIKDYIEYTGDKKYLSECGLPVLVGIARFWAQRATWSEVRNQYVILGVTGPNEYENNVNNNWYTNYIASWCLKYAIESIDYVRDSDRIRWLELSSEMNFLDSEIQDWERVSQNMYFPYSDEKQVFLQQDGFLDKEIIPVSELADSERPINQNWSWDRILRSCFIKQADVLQGLYFFENEFDLETVKNNYDFYEPLTVHESSLSPCVHTIIASRLGYRKDAYEFYLRTARLDLDDYNNDTEDGCHITSMAGTWMAVVKGFGGMKIINSQLHLNPFLPDQWNSFSFKIRYRGAVIMVVVNKKGTKVTNSSTENIEITVFDQLENLGPGKTKIFEPLTVQH